MRFKSQTLTRFTLDLRQAVQAIRGPQVKTARNLRPADPEPQSEAWFAQNLDDFLAAYDWTVPMAMPLMESVPIDASQAADAAGAGRRPPPGRAEENHL